MATDITYPVFIRSYWNYFLELEEQLLSTKRFVDFNRSNNKTFSLEYLKLLQAACSEIDVVAKIMAERPDSDFKSQRYKSIQKWGFVLQKNFPHIEKITVCFNRDYNITPWKNWAYEKYKKQNGAMGYRLIDGKETPAWWTAYNKVKHERTSSNKNGQSNYTRANLGNLISAMAALYILETLLLSMLGSDHTVEAHSESKLFELLPECEQ